MGEMYVVGLQAGRKVTEKVDAFIKAEHKGNGYGQNFDPEERKTLSDGSTIYKWQMKWQPTWYENERKFISTLAEFDDAFIELLCDDDDIEEYAYKLVAAGDEGGQDERGNEIGFESFDGLYHSNDVVFPKSDTGDSDDVIKIERAAEDPDISSEIMGELLTDPNWSTWKMFESLALDYRFGNADVRKGINLALSALTGFNMNSVAEKILSKSENISITVYCSSTDLFTEEECDQENLTEFQFPRNIVEDYYREYVKSDPVPFCSVEQCEEAEEADTFEHWLNNYTADETEGLYSYAVSRGVQPLS